MNGGSSASYLARTLASPCFLLCLIGVEIVGLLGFQGRAGIISIVWWNLRPVIFGVEKQKNAIDQWNPKYGFKGTVTACFALIALVTWKCWLNSTLRKLSVHPKHSRIGTVSIGTVSRAFPLIALIAQVAFFHSTPGAAQ